MCSDIGRDHVHAAMAVGEFERGGGQAGASLPYSDATREPWPRRTSASAWRCRDRVRGGDRAEHLGVVHASARVRRRGSRAASGRCSTRPPGRHRPVVRRAVVQQFGLCCGGRKAFPDRRELRAVYERAHPHRVVARVADGGLREPRGDRFGRRLVQRLRHEDAPDRVHFWPDFCVISRATSFDQRSKASLPAASPGSSRAPLRLSASMFTRTERCATAGWSGSRGRSRPSP